MSDIRLHNGDLSIVANDLDIEEGLQTAIALSLFTDRRAEEGDVLPNGNTDRRGWWADAFPIVPGDKFGSRLWLLERCSLTQKNADRASKYIREALAWLVEDKVATEIRATTTIVGNGFRYAIEIVKPTGPVSTFRYNSAWQAEGA